MSDAWNDREIQLRIERALFESVCRHNADAAVYKHSYFKNGQWFDPEVDPTEYETLCRNRDEARAILKFVRGY